MTKHSLFILIKAPLNQWERQGLWGQGPAWQQHTL